MQKPPEEAVLLDVAKFCCCVNPPLLHRLLVGMAKVKMAGKKDSVGHAAS
jgi:hypothetical protein